MKRITGLKRKMKKKLTVRTLSFIMAAGLLLLVVPFMAMAAGREDPEPGKKGDFSLFDGLYATTRITLTENQQTFRNITAEAGEVSACHWQAYSVEKEKYVNISGGKTLSVTLDLAQKYDYGNGKSYIRCLAEDAEGRILISDVLTVVLPVTENEEADPSQNGGTTSTIETISLFEPTSPSQEGETEPTGQTTEPAETTAESSVTTASSEKETSDTSDTTASDETAPTAPTRLSEEDEEPIIGPDEQEEDNSDESPLLGLIRMFSEMLRSVEKNYTVKYYIQGTNNYGNEKTDYSLIATVTLSTTDDSVDLSSYMPSNSGASGLYEDVYYELNPSLSNESGTVAADGSTVFELYYYRKYKFTFNCSFFTAAVYVHNTHSDWRFSNTETHFFYAKFGENISDKWPDNTNFTNIVNRYKIYRWYLGSLYSGIYETSNPMYVNSTLLNKGNMKDYSYYLYTYQTNDPTIVINYYLYDEHNNKPAQPTDSTTVYSMTNVTDPPVDGYKQPVRTRINYRLYEVTYERETYSLTYNSNGGSNNPSSENLLFGTTLTTAGYCKDPGTNGDSTFLGWCYENGKSVNWDTDTMPAANTTIYASWSQPEVATEYTVTFYLDDTFGEEIHSVEHLAPGSRIASKPTELSAREDRTGYIFNGWKYDNGSGTPQTFVFDADSGTEVNSDMTVYGDWIERVKCTVLFYEDYTFSHLLHTYYPLYAGDKIASGYYSDPSSGTKKFLNWAYQTGSSPDPENDPAFVLGSTVVTQDTIVYAVWKDIYTVTFHPENGIDDNFTRTVLDGEVIPADSVPTPEWDDYHTFLYWNNTESGKFIPGTTQVTGNMDVYAKWHKNEVNLVIHNNGGDNVFTVTGSGVDLKVIVSGGGSATVTHLPFGTYTISPKRWDFRYNSVSSQTRTASAANYQTEEDFNEPLEATFGRGTSRGLNWLGGAFSLTSAG